MYHGNIAATVARALSKTKPSVIWNIRKAVADLKEYKFLTRATLRLGAAISNSPKAVVYCGKYVAKQHIDLGFTPKNVTVIYNGFDTQQFSPSAESYLGLRQELQLHPDAILVGMTARYHPHKDHRNFLQCAARLVESFPGLHFVLAGRGLTVDNSELAAIISGLGLTKRVHLLGERTDIPRVLAGLNVYCQSSAAEGFPNALGEAMASGVPCVTTDAGASAEAVGDCAEIVPVGNSEQLAMAVGKTLKLSFEDRQLLSERMRRRVQSQFSLAVIAEQYESCYLGVLGIAQSKCETVYG